MANYILEIGTEELPYKFIPSAMNQLKDLFEKQLNEKRLEFSGIKTYGTPRRLAVIIEGLALSQPDLEREIKGPPAKIAYDDNGDLSKAGLGFIKKQGASPEDVSKVDVSGIEYLFVNVKEVGKKTEEVLKDLVPELILKLQGSHFMRWGDLEIKFSRPIRWIVSLLDDNVVEFNLGNVVAGKFSRGHRFAKNNDVEIKNSTTYASDLERAEVIVDQEKRKQEIIKQINSAAASHNGFAEINEELLEEVTNLVEFPNPVVGSFDEKYLEVTKDVIVSVLAYHQRYFPIVDKDGKLLNYFITIANHDNTNIENIRKGNEKVVKARLDDAIFFYKEDTKKTLEERAEELNGVTFQKGLGTIADKIKRVKEVCTFINSELSLDEQISAKVIRTAHLCKADLVTNLVREFTELQGVIGTDYARLNNEDELVANGIKDHYKPVSSDDNIAESITGQIVGIADKVDTICGVFALGKAPTGSADPLGLRRAALGIINTLIEKKLAVDLSKVINFSVSTLPLKPDDKEKLIKDINDFIVLRLKNLLTENYKYDVVDAVLGTKNPLSDISDVIARIKVLSLLVKKDSYKAFHESANRIIRITNNKDLSLDINSSLFEQTEETELLNCFAKVSPGADYEQIVSDLENCIPSVEKFFDNVLVMVEDEAVKINRLNLLKIALIKFELIADFSKIVY